jgi:hypothetical protein
VCLAYKAWLPTGSVSPQKKQKRQAATNEVVTPQTGWIFGAVMISQALVVVGILSLRKRRHENLAKADEGYEMRSSHEDALT